MHPKRVKLGPCYYFADHFAPVRETPQDISTPSLSPHSPSLRHTDPIPRCTGLPYPRSLGIGNSSGRLAILDRGVKVSNGRWCGLQRRGNGCTYTTVPENRFLFWKGGSFRRERGGVFSTPLSLLGRYLLVGNEFLSENSRGNVLRSNDFREHRGFDH